MRLLAWGATDVGRKRDHNEDRFLVNRELGLFMVADGMGGHAGGDQASRMAVETVERFVERADFGEPSRSGEPAEPSSGVLPTATRVLRGALVAAGGAIFQAALDDPSLTGMGTTCTALLLRDDHAHVAHVGDSRAYRYRDGAVEQLTEDHSWIHEQVKAGLLTEAEARESRFRHIITRSVGFEREVAVDVLGAPLLAGDCFLLCSDGLSNYVEGPEIGRVMRANYYRRVPRVLIDMACDRGGDDNITVILIACANHAS